MEQQELIPHLFRTEYRKIVAVLCRLLGVGHIEIAEDLVSQTFLQASELWGLHGPPPNPVAWLYTAAKNKTKDYLKRHANFTQNILQELRYATLADEEIEIDLSDKNITDSQLAMIFVTCHPCNPPEAQIGLALNLLCGFGTDEIAGAFLTNREVIYKRLQRAKEKLRHENIRIEMPSPDELDIRMPSVLMTLYLLFNEGYYSASKDVTLRRELCFEAMRLAYLLIEHPPTRQPEVYALLSLMCLHASRFDARLSQHGETILYHDQDTSLWNQDLITQGEYFLNMAAEGNKLSKFHLEAAIACWHTSQEDTPEKWENILQLYNELLFIEYSPIIALNRTYALSKANGKQQAIIEAKKIDLIDNHLYHALLGELYNGVDNTQSLTHLQQALSLARSASDRNIIAQKIAQLTAGSGDQR
jgi:RNA polymerase sigma-70 factor (ECF subfamily)